MNEINKDEMFANLKGFLKTKGIEIQEGSYADGIRKGCEILTDTVNLSQRAFVRAKDAMDKGLDQVRQTVHEHTAPKASARGAGGKTASAGAPPPKSASGKTSSAGKATGARGKKKSK